MPADQLLDLQLPKSVCFKLVKQALKDSSVSVSQDAKSCFSVCASAFILYISQYAQEAFSRSKRKTLTTADVQKALEETDFDCFIKDIEKFHEDQKRFRAKKKIERGSLIAVPESLQSKHSQSNSKENKFEKADTTNDEEVIEVEEEEDEEEIEENESDDENEGDEVVDVKIDGKETIIIDSSEEMETES